MQEFYSCKLDFKDQLIFYPSDKVRWLDLDSDFSMIKDYYRLFSENEIKKEDFSSSLWRICALVEDGSIYAFAGALFMSPRNWEIGAVSTHPEHRNNGYGKSVCSFVALFILDNGKQATCNTDINNHAMIKVMRDIGMVVQ
ncbi:MAG: GNAT family N-acetyltransferase [Eubacteriales bacterium]